MSTTEHIAARLFPEGRADAYATLRPGFTAAETEAITAAVGRPPIDKGAAKAEALKLLSAEFGVDQAPTAYARAIEFAKKSAAVQQVIGDKRSHAVGNSPQAILTIAKAVVRRAGK